MSLINGCVGLMFKYNNLNTQETSNLRTFTQFKKMNMFNNLKTNVTMNIVIHSNNKSCSSCN
jgi:hypothetical protein